MSEQELNLKTLADSFGTTESDISQECKDLLSEMDKGYKVITGLDREKLIVNILERIESDKQIIGAPDRTNRWFEGWKENLDDLRSSGYDLDSLMPKFIRKNQRPVLHFLCFQNLLTMRRHL